METIKYRVTFEKKPEYNGIWVLELGKSGAFNYGNGTCVTVTANGHHHDLIDTRYVAGITQNFGAWCDKYMGNLFDPDFGPHIERLADEPALMPMPGTTTPDWGEKHWGRN